MAGKHRMFDTLFKTIYRPKVKRRSNRGLTGDYLPKHLKAEGFSATLHPRRMRGR